MSACLFCRIVKREIPAKVVFEDELALAFDDINPQAPVHTLVIPKQHLSSSVDAAPDDRALMGHLLLVANQIARDKGVAESGYRFVINTGVHGGQTVFHLHLHLLGGRPMHWPPG
jgi:histidine triad (HIT) family protein